MAEALAKEISPDGADSRKAPGLPTGATGKNLRGNPNGYGGSIPPASIPYYVHICT